ncbi:DUF2474 domain-containing protein [Kluyvera genomosp. 1]|nr:DUF2474 domain-containing protein [Kluyvera genomosp. 1]
MKKLWVSRVFWLVALWGSSVLALTVVGGLFRVLMTAAGFKS